MFLAIPGIHSVFADQKADDLLAKVKEGAKPLDHGKKTEMELFFELKTEFIQNNEKDGMTLKAFYNAKWEDERARYILIDRKNKFMELEDGCKFFKKGNELQFSLSETADCYLEDDPAHISGKECLEVISKAGHLEVLTNCHDVFFKRKDKKKRLVWLYGPRNTGKSSFIALMETIFSTQ
jgi:hypothetical protein